MRLSRLAAVVVAALAVAGPAHAVFDPGCPPGGCVYDPNGGGDLNGIYDFDYTVPDDGRLYRWAITFTSADPAASLFLDSPSQTDLIYVVRKATGFEVFEESPPYTFDEITAPGLTVIRVRAPRAFDTCGPATRIGATCAAEVQVFGNGTSLYVSSSAPIFATFSETVVPEPATWTLMIAGFGLVGMAARRPRRPNLALRLDRLP